MYIYIDMYIHVHYVWIYIYIYIYIRRISVLAAFLAFPFLPNNTAKGFVCLIID